MKKSKRMGITVFNSNTGATAIQGLPGDKFGSFHCLLFIKGPRLCLLTFRFSPVVMQITPGGRDNCKD